MTTGFKLCVGVVLVWAISFATRADGEAASGMRTWTSSGGTTISAELADVKHGRAVLRGEEGQTFQIQIRSLSEGDRAVIKAWVDERGASESPVSARPSTRAPSDGLPLETKPTFWFKADSGVKTDSKKRVKNWENQGEAEVLAIAAPGNDSNQKEMTGPILTRMGGLAGRPSLRFNGENEGLIILSSSTAKAFENGESSGSYYGGLTGYVPTTLFLVVGKAESLVGLFAGSNDSSRTLRFLGNSLDLWPGVLRTPKIDERKGCLITAVVDFDGNDSSLQVWVNGKEVMENTPNADPRGGASTIGMAARIGGGYQNQYFNGDVAELILFDTVLGEPERLAVTEYLRAKYFKRKRF